MTTIAVTGAAGRLGSLIVQVLAREPDLHVVALTRRPAEVLPEVEVRIADYDDTDALRLGLTDVDTMVFVSSDGEGTRVLRHHLNLIAAARDCGVGHIVALSGLDADIDSPFCYAVTNGLTEQAIRESGCGYSILRASLFSEFYAHFVASARSTGELRVPTEDGRISLVSRSDVGHCLAAQAQLAPTGRASDITGPAALDAVGIAATAAQVWDRPVVVRQTDAGEHLAFLALAEDLWWTYAYSSMFASIRDDRWSRVTTDVQRLTGRPPRTLAEVLSGIG